MICMRVRLLCWKWGEGIRVLSLQRPGQDPSELLFVCSVLKRKPGLIKAITDQPCLIISPYQPTKLVTNTYKHWYRYFQDKLYEYSTSTRPVENLYFRL